MLLLPCLEDRPESIGELHSSRLLGHGRREESQREPKMIVAEGLQVLVEVLLSYSNEVSESTKRELIFISSISHYDSEVNNSAFL